MNVKDLLHMINTAVEVGAISLEDNVIIGDLRPELQIYTGLKGVTAPTVSLKDDAIIDKDANMNLLFLKRKSMESES